MAFLDDLKKQLGQILGGAGQAVSNVGNYFNPQSNGGQNFWSTPVATGMANIQQAPQQAIRVAAPVIQQGIRNVSTAIRTNPQTFNYAAQLAQQSPNVMSGFKPLDTAGQFAGQYVNNNMIQPAIQGTKQLSTALNPTNNASLLDRGANLAMGGLNIARSLPLPANQAWNEAFQGYQYAKGAAAAGQQGKSLLDMQKAGLSDFTGETNTGLGSALTKNSALANVGNLAELPLMLAITHKMGAGGMASKDASRVQALLNDVADYKVLPLDKFVQLETEAKKFIPKVFNNPDVQQLQKTDSQAYVRTLSTFLHDRVFNPDIAVGLQAKNIRGTTADTAQGLPVEGAQGGVKNLSSKISGEVPTPTQEAISTGKPQLKVQGQSISNPTSDGIISPTSQDYLKQLQQGQKEAGSVPGSGIIQKGQSLIADIKRKLVDSTAPIEDILSSTQKKGQFDVLPSKNVSYQIDRAIRSRELAGQFLKDNGMVDVIRDVPDVNTLDQYLIAKHAPEVATATGRNAQADAKLVQDLAPTYEPYAQKVIQYGQKLLDYATETGLVSKSTADGLKAKYPNYVPLNRIFTELEKATPPEGAGVKGVASLSNQTVVQKLQGSDRAIQNPTESLLTKTLDAFGQGERNQAGQMLASYKDLPGNPFQLRELKPGESALHTVSYLDNGAKKTFETSPEIAQAAKFLDKRQLGLIGQIFAMPVRLARVGITGLNIPFIASNIAKDQVSATINSNHALATSIANPGVFLKSLWTAIGHGAEYDNWIRNAGGGTSFDISRSAPATSIGKIRAGRSVVSNVAYTVTHPAQLLRTVENIVSRGEELTRLQQFTGTKQALLGEGRTAQDANILAGKASRTNTVDFARSGDWGKALNSVFLYMNAGIQGSRTLVRNLQTRPVATAAKIGLTVFTPLATVTAWNLSDPKRAAAYNDVRDFEKENNLIIVPPNPTKDPTTGKWNVIKVPFSQEIANLTIPVRKSMEALAGYNPPSFMDVAAGLLGSATSLNTQSPNALVGQFVPQAVKPPLEAILNKNMFSGNDIVPQYINGMQSKDLPPDMQAYNNTSGTARAIAKPLNISPLQVEQFVKSTAGGVGSQLLNASDQALAAGGVIPKEQIGGQSITQGLSNRFMQATGGQQLTNLYDKGQTTGAPSTGTSSNINSGTSGLPGVDNSKITENRGKFYASLGPNNVKAYDTFQEAQLGIAKENFANSSAKFLDAGDTVFYKTSKGSVQTMPKDDYLSTLYDAKLTQLKAQGNYQEWSNVANQLSQIYVNKLQDPNITELDKVKLENKLTSLAKQMDKGFGGSGIRIRKPSLTLTHKVKAPSYKNKGAKIKTTAPSSFKPIRIGKPSSRLMSGIVR